MRTCPVARDHLCHGDSQAAEAALAVNDLDEACPRREALAIDRSSQRALALQEEALQSPQQAQTARPTADTPTASARAEARALRPEVRREEAQAGPRRLLHNYRWAITAAAGLILLAAVIGADMSRGQAVPRGPRWPCSLPAPWATIWSVQREGGDAVVLPEDASTPLALRLNPGDYRVVLQGPPPQLGRGTISVRVEPGVAATLPAQKFDTISVEEGLPPVPFAGCSGCRASCTSRGGVAMTTCPDRPVWRIAIASAIVVAAASSSVRAGRCVQERHGSAEGQEVARRCRRHAECHRHRPEGIVDAQDRRWAL